MKHALAGLLIIAAVAACDTNNNSAPASTAPFTVVEKTIPEMQQAMKDGRTSSRHLVEQ